jgi:peptidoglycan/LPS O-acetylase OafA/YrhL
MEDSGAQPSRSHGYLPDFTRFNHSRRLDGVRGLAILLVVIGHLCGLPSGGLGVIVFFCLSGYLITSLLIAERNRTGSINLKIFYIRRFLRLYPALLVYLLVLLALRPFGFAAEVPMISWISSLVYLRNIVGHGDVTGHLWTLSMEEQFYLLWPVVLLKFPARKLAIIASAVIGIVMAARTVGIILRPDLNISGIFYMRPIYRADSILVGCLLGLMLHSNWSANLIEKVRSIAPGPSVLILTVALLLWSFARDPYRASYIDVQVALSLSLLAMVIFSEKGAVTNILDSRILSWLGVYSYSIYIWQQLFIIRPPPFFGGVPFSLELDRDHGSCRGQPQSRRTSIPED